MTARSEFINFNGEAAIKFKQERDEAIKFLYDIVDTAEYNLGDLTEYDFDNINSFLEKITKNDKGN